MINHTEIMKTKIGFVLDYKVLQNYKPLLGTLLYNVAIKQINTVAC